MERAGPVSTAAPHRPVSRRPSVPRPPGASRYGWFVAVVLVLVLAYITLNTARTERASSTGPKLGQRLPPFAAPLATGTLEGDANIATKRGQGEAGARPACEVRGPQILNVCQLAERGPVALAFLATRGARCERQMDVVERLRRDRRYRDVQFAAVAIRGDREDLRRTIRSRGWRFPVGYDRDGAVANLYGVAVCPQITFADRRGKVRETVIGQASEAELRRKLDLLLAQRR